MYGMPACSNLCEMSRTISISFIAGWHLRALNNQLSTALESLLGRALAKKLGDIEIHEIGVMKNDRFDRPFHLVALMAVRCDNVQHLPRNAVFVGQRHPAEGMA